jgi:hypothetical protein
MADELKKLLKMHKVELQSAARRSMLWFEQQAFNLLEVNNASYTEMLSNSNKRDVHVTIRPGNMYFFAYDAKWKDKLPYFDMFPLCLPYAPTADGFIGLNLHYLPYDYRIRLLDRLMDFASDDKLDNQTKILYSWQLLQGVSKFKAAIPCIKSYLHSHVRSNFRIIRPEDWATAAMLPMERFSGSDKFTVWADSLSKF